MALNEKAKTLSFMLALSLGWPSYGYAGSSDDEADVQKVVSPKAKKKVKKVKKKTTVVQESATSEKVETLSQSRYAEDLSRLETQLNLKDGKVGSRLKKFLADKPIDPYGKLLAFLLDPEHLSFLKYTWVAEASKDVYHPTRLYAMLMTIESDERFFTIAASAGLLFKDLAFMNRRGLFWEEAIGTAENGRLGRDSKRLLTLLTHLNEEENRIVWESLPQDRRRAFLVNVNGFDSGQIAIIFKHLSRLFWFEQHKYFAGGQWYQDYFDGDRLRVLHGISSEKLERIMNNYHYFFYEDENYDANRNLETWNYLSTLSLEEIDYLITDMSTHPEDYKCDFHNRCTPINHKDKYWKKLASHFKKGKSS